jgi:hypothetical protein
LGETFDAGSLAAGIAVAVAAGSWASIAEV